MTQISVTPPLSGYLRGNASQITTTSTKNQPNIVAIWRQSRQQWNLSITSGASGGSNCISAEVFTPYEGQRWTINADQTLICANYFRLKHTRGLADHQTYADSTICVVLTTSIDVDGGILEPNTTGHQHSVGKYGPRLQHIYTLLSTLQRERSLNC
jgi:hypothetical protein